MAALQCPLHYKAATERRAGINAFRGRLHTPDFLSPSLLTPQAPHRSISLLLAASTTCPNMSAVTSRFNSGCATASSALNIHRRQTVPAVSFHLQPCSIIQSKQAIDLHHRWYRFVAVEAVHHPNDTPLKSDDVNGDTTGDTFGEKEEETEEPSVKEVGAVNSGNGDRKVEVAVAFVATVVLGVGNRVLYKLALVPLREYPFFLAQLATFGYVLVYFFILRLRHHAGIVTDEMLSMPQAAFVGVGLLEALAAASGMAAATKLSGATIPILSQTFLIWQLLLSIIFLGRRYSANQLFGCFLVAVGVVITVASGSGSGLSLKAAGVFWSLMMAGSFLLQAADNILKEVIFLDTAKQLKGGSVDLFVINSYGSAYQAVFICLLLPILSKMWGIPFAHLPSYLKDGAACFLNLGTLSTGCEGAPLLPVLFVVVNMGFNIALLHLLKVSSAVVSSLASTFSVPLSVYVFTLTLPYLGVGTPLPPGFVSGVAVLVIGLLIYAWKPNMGPSEVAIT